MSEQVQVDPIRAQLWEKRLDHLYDQLTCGVLTQEPLGMPQEYRMSRSVIKHDPNTKAEWLKAIVKYTMDVVSIFQQPLPGFHPQQAVRFIGGKYNGFQGTIRLVCDQWASVLIAMTNGDKPYEVIEETRHMQDLKAWTTKLSATEQNLRGN